MLNPHAADAAYRMAQCLLRLGRKREGERLMAAYRNVPRFTDSDKYAEAAGRTVMTPARWRRVARIYEVAGFPEFARAALAYSRTGVESPRLQPAAGGETR